MSIRISRAQNIDQLMMLMGSYIPNASEADQGAVNGTAHTVKYLVDTVIGGSKDATMLFTHSGTGNTTTYTFATSETIPTNIKIIIEKGALLQFDNGVTLTCNGAFEAGLYKVFTWTGTGKVDFGAGSVKEVYPEWWGENTTPLTTDMTAEIQAAVSALPTGATGGGVVAFEDVGGYLISSTILVPAYVSLIGTAPNIRIQPDTGGSWNNNYCFYLNTTDGITWVASYTGTKIGSIKNLYIYNTGGDITTKGFLVAGEYEFDHITGRTLANLITTTNDYIDGLKLTEILCQDPQGATYQIKINQLGDNLWIQNIQFEAGYGLSITGCWGGTVQSLIGGTHHYFENNRALSLRNWHCEGGRLIIKNSNVYLEDMYLRYLSDVAVEFQSSGNNRYFAGLRNVLFDHRLDDTITGDGHYDIKTTSRYHITFDNVFKMLSQSGTIERAGYHGVFVQKADDSEFDVFNRDSAFLSKHCEITDGQNLLFDYVTKGGSGTLYATGSMQADGNVTWQGATDTFYYTAQLLNDADRLIGVSEASEDSQALTNGGSGLLIPLSVSSYHRNVMLRLYRGTATGSYDEYVDIPLINSYVLYDDGNNINGFEWKSRTAGGMDTLSGFYNVKKTSENFECWGAAAPTQGGSWTLLDKIWETSPAGAAAPGWVCTESGTFGAATDATGDTDGSTAVITGMADTSDFAVGSYVDTSAGFPSSADDTPVPVKILAKTATTITIDDTSDTAEANITVDTSDPVFKAMANLAA